MTGFKSLEVSSHLVDFLGLTNPNVVPWAYASMGFRLVKTVMFRNRRGQCTFDYSVQSSEFFTIFTGVFNWGAGMLR